MQTQIDETGGQHCCPPCAIHTPGEDARSLAALSEWIDNAPANAARDREAATWGRLAKIAEEAGEVIAAFIGATEQNPRKGRTHDGADVIKELLDVAFTALCAVEHMTGNSGRSMGEFSEHVHRVAARAGLRCVVTADRPVSSPVQGEAVEAADLSRWTRRPHRLAVDAKGYVWRVFGGGMWSMAPVNADNSPIPRPVTFYEPVASSSEGEAVETRYPPLRRVEANICEGCLSGEPDECHTPGCAFWMCSSITDEQGEHLRYHVVGMQEAVDEAAAIHAEAQEESGYDDGDEAIW